MIDLLIRISTLYNIPQWAVNLGALAIFIILVSFPFVVKKLLEPKYRRFKEMVIYNVLWKWKYRKDEIIGLWCYCPRCERMLACDDENCKATEDLQSKITFFVCHECGGHEQGRVTGGDRRYALSLVKREILRQIRTGEYVTTVKLRKELLEAIRLEKEALEAFAATLTQEQSHEEKPMEEGVVVENEEQEAQSDEMAEVTALEEEVIAGTQQEEASETIIVESKTPHGV